LSPELFSFLIILVVFGAFPAPSSPGTSFSALFSSSVSSENANARVLFDDDDDADEEADVELQTLLFASEEDHKLLALVLLVAETAIAFPVNPRPRPLRGQSVEERPRDDDMMTRSVLLRDAAVACVIFCGFSFIQNPKKQFIIVHFLLKKSRIERRTTSVPRDRFVRKVFSHLKRSEEVLRSSSIREALLLIPLFNLVLVTKD